jgi:hypothetical protein
MKNTPPPLWKQVLGAVVGATVALAIYGVYEGVAPKVRAYILPQDVMMKDVRSAHRNLSEDTKRRFERISLQTKQMVERLNEQKETRQIEEDLLQFAREIEEADLEEEDVEVIELNPFVEMEMEPLDEDIEDLPDSGIATWLTVVVAGAGATAIHRRRKKKHS